MEWPVLSCIGAGVCIAAKAAKAPLLTFPSIDWQFVFVDDLPWLLRVRESGVLGTAFVLTLIVLRTPLSWKKTLMVPFRDRPSKAHGPDGPGQAPVGHAAAGGPRPKQGLHVQGDRGMGWE